MKPRGISVGALCWCEGSEVLIPVEYVRQGRTDTCNRRGPNKRLVCYPGCPSRGADDAFEVTMPQGAPAPVPVGQDGTGTVLIWQDGLCFCGCGEPVAKLFKQGHDHRMLGAVVRAIRRGHTLTVVAPGTCVIVEENVEPLDWVRRFNNSKHTKVDWEDKVMSRVLKRTSTLVGV